MSHARFETIICCCLKLEFYWATYCVSSHEGQSLSFLASSSFILQPFPTRGQVQGSPCDSEKTLVAPCALFLTSTAMRRSTAQSTLTSLLSAEKTWSSNGQETPLLKPGVKEVKSVSGQWPHGRELR